MQNKALMDFSETMSVLIRSGFSISESLLKISGMKNKRQDIKNASEELYRFLEEGIDFATALSMCSYIKFNPSYIGLVSSALAAGKKQQAFDFILDEYRRKEKAKETILITILYPLIVILLCMAGSVALIVFCNFYIPEINGGFDFAGFKTSAIQSCVEGNAVLLLLAVLFGYGIKKSFNSSREIELYNMLGFLSSGGVDLETGFKQCLICFENDGKIKRKISNALDALQKGMKLNDVVDFLGQTCSSCFESHSPEGDQSKCFFSAAQVLETNQIKKMQILERLMEPGIMLLVSCYIVFLMIKIVLPVLYSI